GLTLGGYLLLLVGAILIGWAVGQAASIDPSTAATLVLVGLGAVAVGTILGMVGKLVCLASPDPAWGRVYLLVAVTCELLVVGLVVAITAVARGGTSTDGLFLTMAVASLLGFVAFMVYLREVALLQGKPGLALFAMVLLGGGIAQILLVGLAVLSIFVAPV